MVRTQMHWWMKWQKQGSRSRPQRIMLQLLIKLYWRKGSMKSFQRNALLMTCALVLCSCGTVSNVMPAPVVQCPKPAPAPASVMQEQEPNFLWRIQNFLFQKPAGLM